MIKDKSALRKARPIYKGAKMPKLRTDNRPGYMTPEEFHKAFMSKLINAESFVA
jgi:hypothetical protein